jgi:RNA polymerase sigma-70 factor (ECF subfamily)
MARINPDILGRLFDEHAGALVLFARQLCDAPEDIVQDAFVMLARQTVVPDRVVPWLYRVVRNGAITAARRTRRRRRREERVAGREAIGPEPWFAWTDDQIDAGHASRLLAELDGETREAIVARLWGGLTFEEIARLQGCSLSTTYRRYQSGLARLQERLEPGWTATKHATTSKTN